MESFQEVQPVTQGTAVVPPVAVIPTLTLCSVCHIQLLPEYYFCPNCGKQAHTPPLPTSIGTQLSLYLFSIILPSIGFLFVNRWKGFTYLRQSDSRSKLVGAVATILLITSTIFTFWYAYYTVKTMVQKTMSEAESSLGGLQGLR